MENKKKKILFVARDDGGCGYFRIKQTCDWLKRAGLFDTEYAYRNPTTEQVLSADLVIMQDSGSVEAANLGKFMRENKIPYMTEFDDFVHHISPNNQGGYLAYNPATLFVHRSMEMSRGAAGMTVSTPQLAREYFPYNPTIFVIPNFLNKEKWDNPIVRRTDDKIRIGWCGGNAHADDLQMISKVLQKLIKEYKGKLIFETLGMTRKEFAWVFPMAPTSTDDVCSNCGFEGTLHHHPGESLDDYPMVLASKGWDIAVAPVINNAFGNCKSDLKIKEYAAAGIPMVASRVQPYIEAQLDGAEVSLATTFEEWYNALKELVENKIKREEIARKNKVWIEKHWIENNLDKIAGVYTQMFMALGLLKKE